MNIVAVVKLVPDLVEELEIDGSGASLDAAWLRLIISEFDDHAIEQAILLKERVGGHVTMVCPDASGVDDVLFTGAARGADRLIKLTGDLDKANNHALARALAGVIQEVKPDLVLTGVQAHNDLDGAIGPLLAEYVGFPYVGYVAGVSTDAGKAVVRKEFPGGLMAEMEIALPAVLGIQAAESPPRYVAISRIRQAMTSCTIEERTVAELDLSGGPSVTRLFRPEVGERATMIDGEVDEVAAKLVEVFKEAGVL